MQNTFLWEHCDELLCGSQMVKLKGEKDAVLRALRKELGPDVDLAKVLEESSTWRGRAQQISILKERIADYQSQQVR